MKSRVAAARHGVAPHHRFRAQNFPATSVRSLPAFSPALTRRRGRFIIEAFRFFRTIPRPMKRSSERNVPDLPA